LLNGGRLVSYDNGVDPPELYGYTAAGFLSEVLDQDQSLVCIASDSHGRVVARTWHTAAWPVYVNGQVPTDGSVVQFGDGTAIPTCTAQTTSSPDCATPVATSPGADRTCTTFYGYQPYTDPLDPRNYEPVSVRDGRSASGSDNTYLTSYGYNGHGLLLTRTTPATDDFPSRRQTSYAYTSGSEAAYDSGTVPAMLLKSATTPGGAVTSYQYYADGDLAKTTDPSGRSTVYTYDALGRVLTSTVTSSPHPPAQTSYAYNALGQLATVTYPGVLNQVTGVTHTRRDSYTYDVDGNLLSLTESDLTGGDPSRTYTYDGAGNLTSQQVTGQGNSGPSGTTVTNYAVDTASRVTSEVIDPTPSRTSSSGYANRTVSFTYDADDHVLTQTTGSAAIGGSSLTSYTYDPAGTLHSQTVHDTGGPATSLTTTWQYNQDGQPVSMTSPRGNVTGATPADNTTSYAYDLAGHLVTQTEPSVSVQDYVNQGTTAATPVTTGGYDTFGDLTQVKDPNAGATSATYDGGGHLTSVTQPSYTPPGAPAITATTAYGYDEIGNVTQVADPKGNVACYTYDALGDVTSASTPALPQSPSQPCSATVSSSSKKLVGLLLVQERRYGQSLVRKLSFRRLKEVEDDLIQRSNDR